MAKFIFKSSIFVLVVSFFLSESPLRAEEATPIDWTVHNQDQTEIIDHSFWGALLSKIVVEGSPEMVRKYRKVPKTTSKLVPSTQSSPLRKGINLLPYEYLANNLKARKAVNDYIRYLQTYNPLALTKEEQLAFWLNLHNSLFVRSVMLDYPIKDLKKLGIEKRDTAEFYQKKRVNIEGHMLSLNDIEKISLIVSDNNPLVPYGLVLGSHSTPNILLSEFTGTQVYAQLERAAGKFINSFGIKKKRNRIEYSSFYDMYSDIYLTGGESGLREHLVSFANEKNKTDWAKRPGMKAMKISKKLNNMPQRDMFLSHGARMGLDANGNIALPVFNYGDENAVTDPIALPGN